MAIMLDGVSYSSLYDLYDAGFMAGYRSSKCNDVTDVENGTCKTCGYCRSDWYSATFCP